MTIGTFEGNEPQIADNAFVDPSALVVGDVTIGEESSVWPMAVIRGDMHKITIGARTSIQDNSVLHITHASEFNPGGFPLAVGSNVTVGHRVILHGCTIEDHCLIGMGSIVLDGAVIQSNVILGAGSLVPQNRTLSPGLWIGSPAKWVRDLNEEEIQFIDYSAANYAKLAKRHMDELDNADEK